MLKIIIEKQKQAISKLPRKSTEIFDTKRLTAIKKPNVRKMGCCDSLDRNGKRASYSPNGISYKNAAILYNRVKHSNLQLYFAVFLPRFS